jgi:hypothetical protein
MSTTDTRFQRRMSREGWYFIGVIAYLGLFLYLVWLMVTAAGNGDWTQAAFWLVLMLGASMERLLGSIRDELRSLNQHRRF